MLRLHCMIVDTRGAVDDIDCRYEGKWRDALAWLVAVYGSATDSVYPLRITLNDDPWTRYDGYTGEMVSA